MAQGDGERRAETGGLREVLTGPFDVLRGPVARFPRATGVSHPRAAAVELLARAVLWSLVLAVLAPATSLVLALSGLVTEDAEPVDAIEPGFFAGFVPLAAALVVGLLAWNHWSLRDPVAYHREMFAALVIVAVPVLVELRMLTVDLLGGSSGELSLYVNGSLVIQAVVAYWVVRFAARDLVEAHARYVGWQTWGTVEEGRTLPGQVATLPADTPRYGAATALTLYGLVWGLGIAAAAGAAAGTLIVPLSGTLVGAYFGAIYGLIPAAMGAVWVLVTVSWRRDTDAAAVYTTVRLSLVAVGAAVLAGLFWLLETATYMPARWSDAHMVRTWMIVVPVVVLLLRRAAPHLAAVYIRRVIDPNPT